MEYTMNGTQRHKRPLDMVRQASTLLSGGALGRETDVSCQVMVQDIVLLRTMSYSILSTTHGRVLSESKYAPRLFKVCHANEQTEDELVIIMDLDGTVVDIIVDHRICGGMSAPLNIKGCRDVQLFMNNIQAGESTLLTNVTSGYHFHHVCAGQEEILDEIEEALGKKHYLTGLLLYEMSNNE